MHVNNNSRLTDVIVAINILCFEKEGQGCVQHDKSLYLWQTQFIFGACKLTSIILEGNQKPTHTQIKSKML